MGLLSRTMAMMPDNFAPKAAGNALADVVQGAKVLPKEWAFADKAQSVWSVPGDVSADAAGQIAGKLGNYQVIQVGDQLFMIERGVVRRISPEVAQELQDPNLTMPLLGAGAVGAGVYGGLGLGGSK